MRGGKDPLCQWQLAVLHRCSKRGGLKHTPCSKLSHRHHTTSTATVAPAFLVASKGEHLRHPKDTICTPLINVESIRALSSTIPSYFSPCRAASHQYLNIKLPLTLFATIGLCAAAKVCGDKGQLGYKGEPSCCLFGLRPVGPLLGSVSDVAELKETCDKQSRDPYCCKYNVSLSIGRHILS